MKELIKHFVDRAEGFSLEKFEDKEFIRWPDDDVFNHSIEESLEDEFFLLVGFPLFLQRAIEGVNRDTEWEIVMTKHFVMLIHLIDNRAFEAKIDNNPDQAKISALQWIMDQEKKAK